MGENANTFTFTGFLDDKPEKKEEQVITYVKVPRHEYALLVAAKARLDVVEKVVDNLKDYAAVDVLKLLFGGEQDE